MQILRRVMSVRRSGRGVCHPGSADQAALRIEQSHGILHNNSRPFLLVDDYCGEGFPVKFSNFERAGAYPISAARRYHFTASVRSLATPPPFS